MAEASATTSRGIMMGLPTSWFFLCLVHFFWIDQACGKKENLKQLAAVSGDDLVALWPQEVIDEYEDLLS
jgi:hypothetical protein